MDLKEKKLGSKEVYKGKIVDLYVDNVMCPNGNESTREVIRHCKASCILARLPNGKFIMEKQFRYPYDKVIYELPAGKCNEGEDHKVAAIRELEEETGFFASHIVYLGKMYPSVAYTDEVIYLYYADELTKTKQNLDENEAIDLLEVSMEDIERMIKDGTIVDAKTLCTILDYKLSI